MTIRAKSMIRCFGCMEKYEGLAPGGGAIGVCPRCGYVKGAPAKEVYHLPPGSILQDKYLVGRALGYGGFGVTYAGYDILLERRVAIKEYLPTNFSTRIPGQTKLSIYAGENEEQFQAGLKSFVEEAGRLSKFNPLPGTVDIYDCFQQNDTGYIVMEYLEGRTIKETLAKNGVFEYAAAKGIVLKALETLKEVHKEGIIHRDIAPDNIFLLEGDDVRLIDFGAARYATTLHSKSLSVILKPGYAPEEQYRSRSGQGPWSDVYALAATFYKMITGVTPEESMERMVKDDLKEPSKLGVKLPGNDENAIMNALLVKASDRTQSADEFARQLTASTEVRRTASTMRKYDAGRTPRWIKILASCLGAIAVALVALVLTGAIDIQSGALVSALSSMRPLTEDEARVPSIIGKLYEEADKAAADVSLQLVMVNKEFNDNVEAGKVVSQNPLPGRIQRKGDSIEVVISAGKSVEIEKSVVPDVTFRTWEEAWDMLVEADITAFKIAYVRSDTVQEDNIISQSIEAGKHITESEPLTIVISQGSGSDGSQDAPDEFNILFGDFDWRISSVENNGYYECDIPGHDHQYLFNLSIDAEKVIERSEWMQYYNAGDFDACIRSSYKEWESDINPDSDDLTFISCALLLFLERHGYSRDEAISVITE